MARVQLLQRGVYPIPPGRVHLMDAAAKITRGRNFIRLEGMRAGCRNEMGHDGPGPLRMAAVAARSESHVLLHSERA
jgi:hypothetical protein